MESVWRGGGEEYTQWNRFNITQSSLLTISITNFNLKGWSKGFSGLQKILVLFLTTVIYWWAFGKGSKHKIRDICHMQGKGVALVTMLLCFLKSFKIIPALHSLGLISYSRSKRWIWLLWLFGGKRRSIEDQFEEIIKRQLGFIFKRENRVQSK